MSRTRTTLVLSLTRATTGLRWFEARGRTFALGLAVALAFVAPAGARDHACKQYRKFVSTSANSGASCWHARRVIDALIQQGFSRSGSTNIYVQEMNEPWHCWNHTSGRWRTFDCTEGPGGNRNVITSYRYR